MPAPQTGSWHYISESHFSLHQKFPLRFRENHGNPLPACHCDLWDKRRPLEALTPLHACRSRGRLRQCAAEHRAEPGKCGIPGTGPRGLPPAGQPGLPRLRPAWALLRSRSSLSPRAVCALYCSQRQPPPSPNTNIYFLQEVLSRVIRV